ncbi:MAG: protein kinase [Thermoflexales bacterium]|nr:protein kinase [Thermoflexales bacterium]
MILYAALIILIGIVFVLGVGIVILLLARPRQETPPTRLPETAHAGSSACPVCGQAQPSTGDVCPHCAAPAGCLRAISGTLAGQSFALQAPPCGLIIGRESDCDVLVRAATVSRHHAQVMIEGSQLVLYDRDSTNGTWLADGRRVSRHVLSIGDRFQIGDAVFVYALPGQPLPPPPPPPVLKPITDLQAHSYFEGYLLLDMLGRGGMSVVYRAQAPGGNCVAIKILDITDEWVARKFIQEGNIGTALREHPSVRIVHDLCYSQDGRPYLVMEYVDGSSLRKLAGMCMPAAQIVKVIGQVCDALDFAHQHHIVHRDIKPENILIAHDGTVKVTDFGIAKLTSAVTVTSDRIVGTPEYISPEQAKGETVGPPSDIYSLGVVVYELLTGQVPFPLPATGSSQDPRSAAYTVIRQHIYDKPTPPGQLNPDVMATPLEKATIRALEKDPNKRYKRAIEFAKSLGYTPGKTSLTPLAAIKAQLTLLDGPQEGQSVPVESSLVIGRMMVDPSNTQISRQHAVLIQKGHEWWLQDVSKHGTWVNGQRVYGEIPLAGEAIIEIAGHKMRVQV